MRPIVLRLFVCAALSSALAGCNLWQDRAELAPPQSRWPDTLPSPVGADAPPPPTRAQYCYRTLAAVDCFTSPQPDRTTGFTGRYPTL